MASEKLSDFEDLQREFDQLLAARTYAEAETILRLWASEAVESGDLALAAHWNGLRGTVLSIEHRNADALAAYEEAERLQPQDGTRCITTASHLLYVLEDASASLAKIEKGLDLLARSPEHLYALPDALGLQAVAWLRLGQEKQALQRFESLRRSAGSGPLLQQIDLRLVAELMTRGIRIAECAAYLDDVLLWASRTKNSDLDERARHLRGQLKGSRT